MISQETNIDRLLKERAKIDVELRRHKSAVTILFTDVVGSTAFFDRYGDTAGLAMIHRHADLATAVVQEFQGTVIKTIGDSVMAQFEDPVLGVRAAIELQRRLQQLNPTLAEPDRTQLRIGLNHGLAFRHGKDVFGDAVNLAARITKRTGPAQILVSRAVREAIALDQDLRCTWLGKVTVEGKRDKEDIFEVIWTDTANYRELRKDVSARFARGELVSPGVRFSDLLEAERATAVKLKSGAPASPPPQITARYEVLEELGRGGMGIVYKARDHETSELVALKVLKPEIASDQAVMERFKNELRLSRRITHRNVCRIYEFNRIEGTAYISMEFVDGESLRIILQRFGTLSVRKGIQIIQQVCAGLREAHQQGIVHRDLKPENVMVDRNGNAKLMDFGIARSMDTSTTATGSIFGTPAYMSPEQAEGKVTDPRTDIYALGLILFEVFTGAPTFTGDTPVAIAIKQVQETPRLPREIEPSVPLNVEKVILKCLEKKPALRFQTVDELEAALVETAGTISSPALGGKSLSSTPLPTPSAAALRPTAPPTPVKIFPKPPVSRPLLSPPNLHADVPKRFRRAAGVVVAVVLMGGSVFLALRFSPLLPSWNSAPTEKASEPVDTKPVAGPQSSGALEETIPDSPVKPPEVSASSSSRSASEAEAGRARRRRVDNLLSQAESSQNSRDFESAIRSYQEALTLDPGNSRAKDGLTSARSAQAEWSQEQLRVGALISKGEQSLGQKDFEAAIKTFEEVLTLDSGNNRAREGLSQARTAQAESLQKERQIAEYLTKADQARKRGDYDAAIQGYEEVLALEPSNSKAQDGLDRAGKAKAAEEAIRRRLKKP